MKNEGKEIARESRDLHRDASERELVGFVAVRKQPFVKKEAAGGERRDETVHWSRQRDSEERDETVNSIRRSLPR